MYDVESKFHATDACRGFRGPRGALSRRRKPSPRHVEKVYYTFDTTRVRIFYTYEIYWQSVLYRVRTTFFDTRFCVRHVLAVAEGGFRGPARRLVAHEEGPIATAKARRRRVRRGRTPDWSGDSFNTLKRAETPSHRPEQNNTQNYTLRVARGRARKSSGPRSRRVDFGEC